MIVVSGALVLVALVLLLAGLFTDTGLTLVYLSIGVSLVSGAFLVIGVLTRRGEEPAVPANVAVPPPAVPVGAATSTPVRPVEPPSGAAYAPAPSGRGDLRPPAAPPPPPAAYPEEEYADYDDEYDDDYDDEYDDEDLDPARTIFVVEGRPRYHVEDCRYLDGKDYEPLDVDIALEEGFTPCGVCRPDEALAAYAEADAEEPAAPAAPAAPARRPVAAPAAADEDDDDEDYVEAEYDDDYDEFDDEDEESDHGTYVETAAREDDRAPRRAAAVEVEDYDDYTREGAVEAEPVPPAPVVSRSKPAARSTRTQSSPPSATQPAGRPQTAALAGRADRTTVTAPSRPAAAAPESAAARSSTVLVIPDRGKYHRVGCRYVRDNADAVERSKAAARRAGYAPCGVCKP